MRFFVPSANNLHEAEEMYRIMRDRVTGLAGSLSDRRIYRLKFQRDGAQHSAMVGSDRHCFGKEPVTAIFEASNGAHYIYTSNNEIYEGKPHMVNQNEIVEAEDFSALA